MSRIGEQLELRFPGEVEPSRVPWGGVSPRELTAAYKRSILKAQAVKSMGDDFDVDQYDLWLPIKKAPRVCRGAPLLVEPKGVRSWLDISRGR